MFVFLSFLHSPRQVNTWSPARMQQVFLNHAHLLWSHSALPQATEHWPADHRLRALKSWTKMSSSVKLLYFVTETLRLCMEHCLFHNEMSLSVIGSNQYKDYLNYRHRTEFNFHWGSLPREQHRFINTEGGEKLFKVNLRKPWPRPFWSGKAVSMAALWDSLNGTNGGHQDGSAGARLTTWVWTNKPIKRWKINPH